MLYGGAAGLTGAGSQFFTQNTSGVGDIAEEGDPSAPPDRGRLQHDGFADLAVGVPVESIDSIVEAGEVNVLFGTAAGLTGSGSQSLTQDSPGRTPPRRATRSGSLLGAGDFNNDGFADLAIGVPPSIGSVVGAGAVNVLTGSAAGLTGTGSLFLTQDTPGVEARPRRATRSAARWPPATSTTTSSRTLAIGVPIESLGSTADAGEVDVLLGTAAGLTGSGGQSFSQDTAGVGSSAEEFDWFGFALAAAGPDGPTTVPTPAVGSATMRELP